MGHVSFAAPRRRDIRFGTDDEIVADAEGRWEYRTNLDKGETEFKFYLADAKEQKVSLKVIYAPKASSASEVTPLPTNVTQTASPPAHTATAAPTPTSPPERTATAAPTASPPPVTIPGLTAVDVTKSFEDIGFTCTGPTRLQTMISWSCSLTDQGGALEYRVDMLGESPTRIRSVNGTVLDYTASPSEGNALPFLQFLATLPYDGAKPEQA